jgi:hypothetical protein
MKHKWQRLPNGEINKWAVSWGYCNGPECVECGYSFCENCYPNEYDSECPGREGLKIYFAYKIRQGNTLGIHWCHRILHIGIWFFAIIFDFNGLFPACTEVKED